MIVIDVAALKRAAERVEAGPATVQVDLGRMALVERRWLGAVLEALLNPGEVRLLDGDHAPATMVPA